MTPLINLLNTILPGDWYEVDPFMYHRMFSDLPIYEGLVVGAFLNVGQHKVRVIRQTNDWYVEAYTLGECAKTEADLIRVVSASVAWLAVKQTEGGNPIPTVPEWAFAALRLEKAKRIKKLREHKNRLLHELVCVSKEQDWLHEQTIGDGQ